MYGNFRNYQLDYANRNAAQAAEQGLMQAQHQAAARANQASREFRQSYGDPRASQSNHDNMIASVTSPYAAAMGQHEMNMRHAMQNAMSNEMTQVQDRMMDIPENQIASKNQSDQMAYDLGKRKIDAEYGAMNNLSNQLGSMQMPGVGDINAQVPNVNIFDNSGKRIGGSYFRKSLLS
jgi:hypothetical protein